MTAMPEHGREPAKVEVSKAIAYASSYHHGWLTQGNGHPNYQVPALLAVTLLFREAMEHCPRTYLPPALHAFPKDCAEMAARLMGAQLTAEGWPCFTLIRADAHGKHHWWVENNGMLVDITGDAFGSAPVVVSDGSEWHRALDAQRMGPAVYTLFSGERFHAQDHAHRALRAWLNALQHADE